MPEQARNDMFEAFRAGKAPVLVATSVFGTGIDIPDIRLIIHITEPDNMREYGQESGRYGRDGEPSRAVIVRQGRPRDERVRAYTDDGGCRRVKLDGYLDGDTTRTRYRAGEVECDWCQAEANERRAPPPGSAPTAVMVLAPASAPASASASASARIAYITPPQTQEAFVCPSSTYPQSQSRSEPQRSTSSLAATSAYRQFERIERSRIQADERRLQQSQDCRIWHEDLRERLNQWKNVCVMCYSRGKNSAHTINCCLLHDSTKVDRERVHIQRTVKFPQSHVCFKCGVPRLICER